MYTLTPPIPLSSGSACYKSDKVEYQSRSLDLETVSNSSLCIVCEHESYANTVHADEVPKLAGDSPQIGVFGVSRVSSAALCKIVLVSHAKRMWTSHMVAISNASSSEP
ncbi:hypothetical protein EYF80_042366 [Liparis tanakae]|uniref:Uncharacterized protein n=1 Tax=Liparis tanakae TaxID=230148 RepID=A0A4Z2G3H8_9TELE|nr:hypothetical protein EYF80_042366 [Liparis tanakae]